MSELLKSVDLKLERAHQQAQELHDEFAQWSSNNPFVTRSEVFNDRHGLRVIFERFTEQPDVDKWGLDLGELIHNLRSSLDNLAFALALLNQNPPARERDISFPIFTNNRNFDKDTKKIFIQLPAEAVSIITSVQPFQRDGSEQLGVPEKDALVLLNKLDNVNKHRSITPVVLVQTEFELSETCELPETGEFMESLPSDISMHNGPIMPECILLQYTKKNPTKTSGKVQMRGMLSITDNGISYNIFNAIDSLLNYTNTIVNLFRRFFL